MVAKSLLVFLGSMFCAALAAAAVDDTLENDGTWTARIDGDARSARQARVVILEFGGHWQELGRRVAGDACRAKTFPITVQKSNKTDVEFSVWGTSVNNACPDFALTLRVKDERTLAGTTSDGHEVVLTREPAKRNKPR